MRERGQVTARAHASAFGHHRRDVVIQQLDQALHQRHAHAAAATRKTGRKQQQHAAHHGNGQGVTQTRGM